MPRRRLPPPALDEFLTYRLNALATVLNRDAARLAARHGLRLPEWRVLANLAAHGPFPPGWLALRHQMDKGLASRTLRALARRGLVELSADPADGRRLLAAITPAGRSLHGRILPDALARQARLQALLSSEELTVLRSAVDRLIEALGGTRG